MATVYVPGGLSAFAGGEDTVVIDAPRIHELLMALDVRYPALAERVRDMAVAIDGQIFGSPGYQPLRPDSEVHFIPTISGG